MYHSADSLFLLSAKVVHDESCSFVDEHWPHNPDRFSLISPDHKKKGGIEEDRIIKDYLLVSWKITISWDNIGKDIHQWNQGP
jgi:hypothetical protein